MIFLIIIGVAALAIIFFKLRVLKNTFYTICSTIQGVENVKIGKAYNDIYYPCTLWLNVLPVPEDRPDGLAQTYDFSFYESHKIIGCEMYSKELEDLVGMQIIPDVVVYQPMMDTWAWKYKEDL